MRPSRGFHERSFDVTMTCKTPGAAIRYTTDGSAPTASHGEVYRGAITIERTTTLRAAGFKENHKASEVQTHSYVFLETEDGERGVIHQPARPRGFPVAWGEDDPDYGMDSRITSEEQSPFYDLDIKQALLALPALSIVLDRESLFDARAGIYSNPLKSGVAWLSIIIICPGLDSRPGLPSSTCWRAWSAREGRC